jgi:hypothetical protein
MTRGLKMNRIEILITGSSGQGVLWLGKHLAKKVLAKNADRQVSFLAEYGAGVRSGKSRAQVVVSDREIKSPFVTDPDIEIELQNGKLRCGCMNKELETKGRLNEQALKEIFAQSDCLEILGIDND